MGSFTLSGPQLDTKSHMVWFLSHADTNYIGFRSDGSWSSRSIVIGVGAAANAIDPVTQTFFAIGGEETYDVAYLNAFCLADPIPQTVFYGNEISSVSTSNRAQVVRHVGETGILRIYSAMTLNNVITRAPATSANMVRWTVYDNNNTCPRGDYPSQKNAGVYNPEGDETYGPQMNMLQLEEATAGFPILGPSGIDAVVTALFVDDNEGLLWVAVADSGYYALNVSASFGQVGFVSGSHGDWVDYWSRPLITHYFEEHKFFIGYKQTGGRLEFVNASDPTAPVVQATITLPTDIAHVTLDEERNFLYALSYVSSGVQSVYVVEIVDFSILNVTERTDLHFQLQTEGGRYFYYSLYDSGRHMMYLTQYRGVDSGNLALIGYLSLKGDLSTVNSTVFSTWTGSNQWAPAFVHPHTGWPWLWDRLTFTGAEFSVSSMGKQLDFDGRRFLPTGADFSAAIVDEDQNQVYWVMGSGMYFFFF